MAAAAAGALVTGSGVGYAGLRRKGLHRWLLPYLRNRRRMRGPKPGEPVTLLLAVCDHYEPKRGNAPPEKAYGRVKQWVDEYPRLFGGFRDSGGRPPRHTFFYPADEYEPRYVEMVAGLCRAGYGEVEIHLHHHDDTAENLRRTLTEFKTTLHERHGLLSRDKETGEIAYGFIHGDWALDNSRSDGRHCGVVNELDVLRETGCYADFTMPSAPSETQTATINSIYWAVGRAGKRKSHNTGIPLGVGPKPENGLLMIQGPLLPDWTSRKWGILPKIENGCLQKTQPPGRTRLDNWLRAGVKVQTRPDWYFVKLHTHGVNEPNQDVLLGRPMVEFHKLLQNKAVTDPNFRFYYVSAREMANLSLAAEQCLTGEVPDLMNIRWA